MSTSEEITKLYVDALKNLRKVEEHLTTKDIQQGAEILRSRILQLEIFANVYLKDISDLEVPEFKYHALEKVFYRVWHEAFPMYGNPSFTERQAVRFLFFNLITPVYPTATEITFYQAIQHLKESTIPWVVEYQTIGVFCKHFRKFVVGPMLIKEQQQPQKVYSSDPFAG